MKGTVKTAAAKICSTVVDNLSIMIFSLLIFYSVYLLFGPVYILIIFPIIITYKVNNRKCITVYQLTVLIITQFLMVLFAFLATLSLPLCIVLNLTVPFLLVYLQTSQFNPQGYFVGALCFTFLQLRPVGWHGFLIQLAIMSYGMAALAVLLIIYSFQNRKIDFAPAQKGLLQLAGVLRKSMDPDAAESNASTDGIFQILQELYKEAYKSRGLIYVVNWKGRMHYMLALLFQRSAYFLSNPYQVKTLKDKRYRSLLTQLAEYMEFVGTGGFNQEELMAQGSLLLSKTDGREDPPCLFAQNFLQPFLLILKDVQQPADDESEPRWKLPVNHQPLKKIFNSITMDRFESRFAMRLSFLLTVAFTITMISQADNVYWFALNAFLLLRPMYEESVFRVKTRFAGTIAGCLLMQPILILFPGIQAHVILASITIVGLYMVTAGTWKHGLFATSFALSLSTMMLPTTLATELRLLYVVAAIILVMLVNRFFFPMSKRKQFRYNLNQLFHMHHAYLQLLEKALRVPTDYGTICDIQIHYHLIHGQLLNNLSQTEHADFIKKVLKISWHMSSEAEQMLYLVNNKRLTMPAVEEMENYLRFTAFILNEIQTDLNLNTETMSAVIHSGSYKRNIEDEPRLSYIIEQYSKHVSRLYRCVCRYKQ